MELPEGVEALIFDCDGTLVETGPVYARAWGVAFGAVGQVMAPDWYHARAGMSEGVLIEAFATEAGVRLEEAVIRDALRAAMLTEVDTVREIALVAAIARRYRGVLPMAVGSGGSEVLVMASLRATGLLALFDTVVTIDAVGRAKPAPDIFLEAARRMAVPAGACLVFEDSREGMAAARAAGMRVVSVPAILEGKGALLF